ncbi:hypothetical protein [Streptomyces sp. NL15-2K]|uniref:hypothetical protein n=1 Tax=Streptomyces sp. NL15-2K TaxID=376149 RepID=UPI000F569243|nr:MULTISPECIES: hypothetical protein [Actinomycetes]WKX14287.1 hypothetical protein Q4V64_44960 [Kutzneria buriramensis]GCB53336.1 hypothetical protein SNL152K_10693 [Streptomyces sp. NL15-2K]
MAQALREICERLLPPRRLRSNPRLIKRKMASWKLKRAEHRHPPCPELPAITITKPTRTTPTRRTKH